MLGRNIRDVRAEHTWFEQSLAAARRHPVIIVIGLLFAAVVGLGTLTDSLESIIAFMQERVAGGAPVAPRNPDVHSIIEPAPSPQQSPSPSGAMAPRLSEPTKSPPTVPSQAPSAEKVFRTLEDKKLTELQRFQFIGRTAGTRVRWDGYVRDVRRMWESDEESPIMLMFVPTFDAESRLPALVVATFPRSAEADLTALSEGDHVSIAGRLEYTSLLGPEPALRDCELVTLAKKPK